MATYTDYSSQRDKLADEIGELETVTMTVNKPELPKVTLQEKEYDPPSDAQLRDSATAALADYKRQNENAIRANSAAEESSLSSQRTAVEKQLGERIAELDNAYAEAARRVDNDVIKRGLGRSSIAVNSKQQLESERLGKTAELQSAIGGKIAELDSAIASISDKLKTALNDFNLTYAAKLNEKLEGLKAERTKKIDEVTEYNNNIRAKQAALDIDREKAESSLYNDAIKQRGEISSMDYLSDKERDAIYKDVYNKLDAFLGSMSKSDAKHEIQSYSIYREHLSNKYFYMLYDKYGR